VITDDRVPVTGGRDFIGSHLCERLVERGNEILFVDNFYTGRRSKGVKLLEKRNLKLIHHDVTFTLFVEVNRIFNLACPVSPVHYQFDPVQTTTTSVHGAIKMLGLPKSARTRVVQASTSEVYGDPEQHPQSESYWGRVNSIGIRSRYDEGKRYAETLF
jgi:UDP-glucuronate decarboxylase